MCSRSKEERQTSIEDFQWNFWPRYITAKLTGRSLHATHTARNAGEAPEALIWWVEGLPLLLKLFDNVLGREVEVDLGRQQRVMA